MRKPVCYLSPTAAIILFCSRYIEIFLEIYKKDNANGGAALTQKPLLLPF